MHAGEKWRDREAEREKQTAAEIVTTTTIGSTKKHTLKTNKQTHTHTHTHTRDDDADEAYSNESGVVRLGNTATT